LEKASSPPNRPLLFVGSEISPNEKMRRCNPSPFIGEGYRSSSQSEGYILIEVMVSIMIAGFFFLMMSVVLYGFLQGVHRLNHAVLNFDRAVQAFFLIEQDVFEATSVQLKNVSTIESSLPLDIEARYPISHPFQVLERPPEILKIPTRGERSWVRGQVIWAVHLLKPWIEVSGEKGSQRLKVSSPSQEHFILRAWKAGDVVGIHSLGLFQLADLAFASPSTMGLNAPLKERVDQAQLGLLSNSLWYVGQTEKGEDALYRHQNGINEKMVEGVQQFRIQERDGRSHLLITIEGKIYDFS
jgi:hypothetical protein